MREIKFRARHYDNGEWVYGDLQRHSTAMKYVFINTKHDGTIQVIPETVGQFTGLKDKNGKEIFESDLIKIPDYKHYWQVVYDRWGIPALCSLSGLASLDFKELEMERQYLANEVEIIGNIYSNPELLK